MNETERLNAAKELGRKWFAAGGKCAPWLDPDLRKAMEAEPKDGSVIKLMEAWQVGWHMANLGEEL